MRDRLLARLRAYHEDCVAQDLAPDMGPDDAIGVPFCSDQCPVHDGKRCIALGRRTTVCLPAVEALVALVQVGEPGGVA